MYGMLQYTMGTVHENFLIIPGLLYWCQSCYHGQKTCELKQAKDTINEKNDHMS